MEKKDFRQQDWFSLTSIYLATLLGLYSHSISIQHFTGKIFMTISNCNTTLQVQRVSLQKPYIVFYSLILYDPYIILQYVYKQDAQNSCD